MKLNTLIFPPSLKLKGSSSSKTSGSIRLIFLTSILFLATNCSEILSVPNISHERVEILSPSDGSTVDKLPVSFSWVGIEDASHYRIQIFTPSIEGSQRILVDSVLTTEFFTDSLTAENIEWRVRAENSSYQSAYSSRKFKLKTPTIGTDSVHVLAPKDGIVQTDLEMFFSWDLLSNAEQYRIQVGKPSFEELEVMLVDSIIVNSNFTKKLEHPGEYQWRVRGENQGIFTTYTTRSFTIETDITLQNETVPLWAPNDGIVFRSNNNIRFTWENLKKASHYRIQIATPDFENTEQYLVDTLTTVNHFTRVLENQKNYQWRVRAENQEVFSQYNTRNLTIKDYNPLENTIVNLLAPVDSSTLKKETIKLSWEAIEKAKKYHVQVSTPNFKNAEQFIIDTLTEETNITHSFEDGKTYQWRVKGLDDFEGTNFSYRTFNIQTLADLSAETVVILAPRNNAKLSNVDVNLSWEELDGATSYHIQVATPSFSNALQIVADSRVSETNYRLNLDSGSSYEWRVQAHNASSETLFSTHTFSLE